MATAEIAQRDEPHVAGIIGRDEDVAIHRQIAAPLREMRDAGLVGHRVFGVLALERREADRVGLAGVDVADIDDLAGQRRRRALEAERRQAVVTRVAHRRIDFAVVADDRRSAELVGHHQRPRPRRAMGEQQRPAVGRKGERPAVGQRRRRLDRARLVESLLEVDLGDRRQAETLGDEFGRPHRVVGAADDEFRLGRAVSGELDFEREAGGGIEGPQLAFVIRLSRAPRARSRSAWRANLRRGNACANPRSRSVGSRRRA